jgi:phospholipase/lecithinase/hemolysin
MRLLISVLVLCLSTMVSATTLTNVVVFGDSLSDNGNFFEYMKHQLPMDPPYYRGRFTNGPVWVELLTESFYHRNASSHLLDYAYAGAAVLNDDDETPLTLRNEVSSYLLSHQDQADPNSLYVVWIGANNYLALPEDGEQTVREVNDGIKASLQHLIDRGAKYFLVLNMPDLGRTPGARDYDAVAALTNMAERHNELLVATIDAMKTANPSVQFVSFDVKSALDEMLTRPQAYGFTNVTDTCYESAAQGLSLHGGLAIAAHIKVKATPNACDGYLFFDPVHPTVMAHRIMAERTRAMLDDAGITLE